MGWLTPDGDVQLDNVIEDRRGASRRIRALKRNADFPADIAANNIYAFDPLDDEELEGYLEEAKVLASVVGFNVVGFPAASIDRWYICNLNSEHFGEEVPVAATQNERIFKSLATVGMLELNGVGVHAVKLSAGETWDRYLQKIRSGHAKDSRLLGDQRDSDGIRHLAFKEVLEKSKEEPLVGFPLRGKRLAREMPLALRDAGRNGFEEHDLVWAKASGVGEKSAAGREHRLICRTLRLLLQYDHIDISNTASGEFMCRRLFQVETAVRRNPKQPDYEGLYVILESAIDEKGGTVVPAFSIWLAEQRTTAAINLKAARQLREEEKSVRDKGGKDG